MITPLPVLLYQLPPPLAYGLSPLAVMPLAMVNDCPTGLWSVMLLPLLCISATQLLPGLVSGLVGIVILLLAGLYMYWLLTTRRSAWYPTKALPSCALGQPLPMVKLLASYTRLSDDRAIRVPLTHTAVELLLASLLTAT